MKLFLANLLFLANKSQIQGFHVDYGTDSSQLYYGNADIFLGIPYVEPPLGDLRFAKPKPITKFPQPMINATSWKPACPQAEPCGTMKAPYDEDCLYLNVFAPNGSRTPANKAVMVFIHGGSFDSGCAQEYPYKAGVRTFVSQDVIVVTIQYRLGFWGFFTTLTDDYPANRGLLDQIEALKWVQNNIAKFGGDPKKVTIFGESAGSASVSAHSFSPLSRGLFAQTIQESGAALTCLKTIAQSVEQAGKLCGLTPAQFNGNDFSSLAPCLKNRTTADILKYDEAWNMVFDNNFLNDTLENLGKKRPNLPAILGNMRDEYTYFILHRFYADLTLANLTRSFVEWTFRSEHQYMGDKMEEILAILEQ
ncbi:unnamed protein product, partial [Mesorhabditis belari]|uniref:Carboxylic ester hydrolase n=1 Tax=Mesorhabditis belari TaxID=2138241 RepID=A0AAF3F8A8_9BILA